jgi:hypothetical protein
VYAFKNKIIFFSPEWEHLTILDDILTEISTAYLKLQAPLLSVASVMDTGVIEYIDAFNNRFPFPIMGNF